MYNSEFHHNAMIHLVQATKAANAGDEKLTNRHLASAKQNAKTHVDHMVREGNGHLAPNYSKEFDKHTKRIDSLLRIKLSKSQVAYSLGIKPSSKYEYKPLNELSPEDQKTAHSWWGQHESSMHDHVYPVDIGTNKLSNSQRLPLKDASSGSIKSSKHTAGDTVRIVSPGHDLYHKLGIVKSPNPQVPGRVVVDMGPTHGTHHFFEEELRGSKLKKMEKALAVVKDIRDYLKNK